MTPAQPRLQVVGDGAHDGVCDGVEDEGDPQGDGGQEGRHPQHLVVEEQQKRVEGEVLERVRDGAYALDDLRRERHLAFALDLPRVRMLRRHPGSEYTRCPTPLAA